MASSASFVGFSASSPTSVHSSCCRSISARWWLPRPDNHRRTLFMTFVLSGNLRRLAGFQNEIEASGTTLGECVDDMVGRNPRLGPVLLDAEGKMRGIIR